MNMGFLITMSSDDVMEESTSLTSVETRARISPLRSSEKKEDDDDEDDELAYLHGKDRRAKPSGKAAKIQQQQPKAQMSPKPAQKEKSQPKQQQGGGFAVFLYQLL